MKGFVNIWTWMGMLIAFLMMGCANLVLHYAIWKQDETIESLKWRHKREEVRYMEDMDSLRNKLQELHWRAARAGVDIDLDAPRPIKHNIVLTPIN